MQSIPPFIRRGGLTMQIYRVEVRNASNAILERVLVLASGLKQAHDKAIKQLEKEYRIEGQRRPEKFHASSIETLPERVLS